MTKEEIALEHVNLAYESICVLPPAYSDAWVTMTDAERKAIHERRAYIAKRIEELRTLMRDAPWD